ncbi:hypothetical protein CDD82_4571 [Ophiocordyceps australis]|uniref:Proline dehydrogenase n=1 Tax=Ophiocordyceps australis TaxID=1399860 RepID=A0A2C5YXM1_9HYPO|nr:hypothetical protein CDD82_4571 [Ophiocordyceps australis]
MRPVSFVTHVAPLCRGFVLSTTPSCRVATTYCFRRGSTVFLQTRQQHTQRRGIHVTDNKASSATDGLPLPPSMTPEDGDTRTPLAMLPLSMVLRSFCTSVVSSSPLLLKPSLQIMSLLANSSSPVLNPDRNPLLRFFLKQTFYAQFCAGENAVEVGQTVARVKGIGFTGVILNYAKEVELSDSQAGQLKASNARTETQDMIDNEVRPWAEGTLATVGLTEAGDFVAVKFTGAGRLALNLLAHRLPPTPTLAHYIESICQLAQQRGVQLLFDAEQDRLQDGIDDWTLMYAARYNTSPDFATIYGTYQAYKKCAPEVLARHLNESRQRGFSLGVKLVRGAYLGSDPRSCFHDSKAETDACFDGLSTAVLTRQWNDALPGKGPFPDAHLVLATHNAESVRQARAICDAGDARSPVAFAQLQGMADEISCELVDSGASDKGAKGQPVFKYMVWGTTGECMKYLLRRAQENKDAIQRTRHGRDAMWAELVRRFKSLLSA